MYFKRNKNYFNSKVSKETINECISNMLKYSKEEKKRKFTETVELQIALKNYDPSRDKRFAGTVRWAFFSTCFLCPTKDDENHNQSQNKKNR